MDINTLKTLINAYIRKNGVQAITGDILNGVLLKMADYTTEGDAQLQQGIRDVTDLVDRETGRAIAAEEVIQAAVLAEVQRATLAEEALDTDLGHEILHREEQGTELQNGILEETERATSAESELSARIDTIVQGRNVRDIVANYDELLAYDTSTLGDNDIIMVLLDATKSGHTTYYRWNLGMQEWVFIGGLAFTYTKTEIDAKFAALHIVLPTFNETSSQDILAQVDTMVRSAGADASFKVAIPVDELSGNLDVTYVKSNPANLYMGVFADDRSVLYHITRTISQPRTYTCEVITKTFVEVSDFESEVTRIEAEIATKQPALVSGENIKTINGNSLLGAGNLEIEGGDNTKTLNLFARAMADLNVSAPLLDRVTANGETIKEDSIAVVKSIKGKSLVVDGRIVNTHADGIKSYDVDGNLLDTLDLSWIKDIKDEDGNLLFPDGMCGAGSYGDGATPTKATKGFIVKVFDGTEEWFYATFEGHRELYTQLNGGQKNPKAIASHYALGSVATLLKNKEYTCAGGAGYSLWIRDDSYTSLAQWKSHLADLYAQGKPLVLYYELAEPIEVTYDEKQAFYAVANGGREVLITDGESSPADTIIGYKK